MLLSPGYKLHVSVLCDFVDDMIVALLGINALDGNKLLLDSVTNHLWKRIIINNYPFRLGDICKIKLFGKGDHLYQNVYVHSVLYTMAQL